MFDKPFVCKHQWKETKRKRTLPVSQVKAEYIPRALCQDLLQGFTTIEQACSLCGELKHYKVVGEI